MDRSRFMRELEELLLNIPAEERESALQFYNDYFDEAGVENEQEVIAEFESPQKVAAKIREDIYGEGQREEPPVSNSLQTWQETPRKAPWSNNLVKILLIIAIVVVGGPIIIPVVIGIACAVFGCLLAVIVLFFALVLVAFAIAISGIIVFIFGIPALFTSPGVGLALLGGGLILSAVGAAAVVAGIRLCMIVLPGIIRGFVSVCRWPFQRRTVKES